MPVVIAKCTKFSMPAALAELVGTLLFVLCGAGSAMTSASSFQVALVFGLAITALAYTLGNLAEYQEAAHGEVEFKHTHSGAQFNCAVTFGLVLAGHMGAVQGVLNFVAQLVGAILGAIFARNVVPQAQDQTFGADGPGLACNVLQAGMVPKNAFFGEMLFTCLLVLVFLESTCSERTASTRGFAGLAIGLAVFLGHSVLIPIDGCSINPTRSLGTAIAAKMSNPVGSANPFLNFWVFVVGPLLGAAIGAAVYHILRIAKDQYEKPGASDSAWFDDEADKEAIAAELDEGFE